MVAAPTLAAPTLAASAPAAGDADGGALVPRLLTVILGLTAAALAARTLRRTRHAPPGRHARPAGPPDPADPAVGPPDPADPAVGPPDRGRAGPRRR
jgi:hypothetical protein